MLAYPILLLLAVVGTNAASVPLPPHARGLTSEVTGLAIDAKINLSRLSNLVAADIARAAHFKNRGQSKKHSGKRQSVSISATNTAVDFTSKVKIGNPAKEYNLLLDSGSSNTFVGLKDEYSATSSSSATGKSVSVTYGSGSFSGPEYTDKIDLGSGLVINSQRIAGVNHSTGFDGSFDGILGIGPTDLTSGTVSGSTEEIPTILDNLFSQKTIGAKVLGMSLPPFSSNTAGSISFGGADSSKYKGELTYTNVTKTDPAKDYWGVDQSITYGSSTILNLTAGIIDSGSTMILLATDAFNAYKQATGATLETKTGLLKLPKDKYDSLQPLKFTIGGVDYTLNKNAQIFPRSLNEPLGGDKDSVYLVVGDLHSNSGDGLDFINGYAFMERFYTAYDAENSKLGLATTEHTESEQN